MGLYLYVLDDFCDLVRALAIGDLGSIYRGRLHPYCSWGESGDGGDSADSKAERLSADEEKIPRCVPFRGLQFHPPPRDSVFCSTLKLESTSGE